MPPSKQAGAAKMAQLQGRGTTRPNACGTRRCTTGLYAEYVALHDYLGRGTNDVMKRLKRIKAAQRQ
jgi:L-ribulokinase